MAKINKCETLKEADRNCHNKAKFKIIDIVCEFDNNSFFWVCGDCIRFFIPENIDNPHYIILEEKQ